MIIVRAAVVQFAPFVIDRDGAPGLVHALAVEAAETSPRLVLPPGRWWIEDACKSNRRTMAYGERGSDRSVERGNLPPCRIRWHGGGFPDKVSRARGGPDNR
jgi:hypothetical protein